MAFSRKILAIGICLIVALVVLSFPTSSMSADSDDTYTAQVGSPADSLISDQAMERAALVALYNSTDGDHWYLKDLWLTTEPHCSWWGVLCDANGSVIYLRLFSNGLNGPIPPELDNLSNLEALKLDSNQLSGSIPSQLGSLGNLLVLYLDGNQLSGTVPKELGNLSKLEQLTLHGNQLSGPIPSELGNLSNLRVLSLRTNQLSGSIPPELGNLSNLEFLALADNQLSGSIPSELGSLNKLTTLWLSYNQLSGSIPKELGNLSNLQELELGRNQLSGSIPPELGNLVSMIERLSLGRNQLSGSIPPELGNLSNLKRLNLSFNQLSGPIPSELGNLSNLGGLHLSFNQLSGPIPPELGNLSNLYYRLDLNDNQLSGPIPKELGNLTNLEEMLDLSHNQLSGPIPPELGNLSSLWRLMLDDDTGLCVSTLELLNFLDNLYDYVGPRTLCDDTTPPTLSLPPDTVLEATSSAGAVHHFTATATDDMDPSPVVECDPPSGSTFPLGTTWVTCTATDASGNSSSGDFTVTVEPVTVDIDIKPGSDPNCFNSDDHGVIPIAILSGTYFDATQVDPLTIVLDGQNVRVVGKGNVQAHSEDVNGDGLDDLVVQIEDTDGTYGPGDAIATLTGATFEGTPIQGTDSICIVP